MSIMSRHGRRIADVSQLPDNDGDIPADDETF